METGAKRPSRGWHATVGQYREALPLIHKMVNGVCQLSLALMLNHR